MLVAAALLLIGGVEVSTGRPTTMPDASHPASTPMTRQALRHPADSILLVTPQRPAAVRALRTGARSSGLRWLAIVLAALVGIVSLQRRASRTVLPFVRSVVSRDLVRRRGPPAVAPC